MLPLYLAYLLAFPLGMCWVETHPAEGPCLCLFRQATHLDCPSCGMTRAFRAMGRLNFSRQSTIIHWVPRSFWGRLSSGDMRSRCCYPAGRCASHAGGSAGSPAFSGEACSSFCSSESDASCMSCTILPTAVAAADVEAVDAPLVKGRNENNMTGQIEYRPFPRPGVTGGGHGAGRAARRTPSSVTPLPKLTPSSAAHSPPFCFTGPAEELKTDVHRPTGVVDHEHGLLAGTA